MEYIFIYVDFLWCVINDMNFQYLSKHVLILNVTHIKMDFELWPLSF